MVFYIYTILPSFLGYLISIVELASLPARPCMPCAFWACLRQKSSPYPVTSPILGTHSFRRSKLLRCTQFQESRWKTWSPNPSSSIAWTWLPLLRDRTVDMKRRVKRRQLWRRMALIFVSTALLQGQGRLTVVGHRLAKGWSYAEDDSWQYILIAGDQEKGRILGVLHVRFFSV